MKRFVRYICFILALSLVLVTPAFAAETDNARSSSYFAKSSAYLTTVSGNTFKVNFRITATGLMDELGSSMIIVQRRASSSDPWENAKTFYPSTYTNMIDYNQATHASSVTYTGTSGYEYRAYVEFYAKNSNGTAYAGAYAYF